MRFKLLRPITSILKTPPLLRRRTDFVPYLLFQQKQHRCFTIVTERFPDMEVSAGQWHLEKNDILKRIDEADFIAFDLELSGISMTRDKGRHSVQQRYQEVKKAAEQHQIFQLGVCPVRYDAETETYILSPYNFYVNPIAAETTSTTVERSFSISSSAADFLRGCGFDFNAVFRKGVPYISRAEEKVLIKAEEAKNGNRTSFAKVDKDSEKFVLKVEADIREWMAQEKPENDFLNIASPHQDVPLNRYQRLLVHQIVQLNFPGLVSYGKGGFVQVKRYDEERERKDKEEKMERFQKALNRSIGLRAIVDKLLVPKGEDGKKHVIVGHNVFSDLIYLYECFVGPLPPTVQEFGKEIADSCKMVIDTKFMATFHSTSGSSNSSLQSMWECLSTLPGPNLSVPPAFLSYMANSAHHEAGYDAFNTARVLLYMAPIIQNIQPYLVSKIHHNGEVAITSPTLYMLEALYGPERFTEILEEAKKEAKEKEEKTIKEPEERDEDQEIRDAQKEKQEPPTEALAISVEAEFDELLSRPKAPTPEAVLSNNPFEALAVESTEDDTPEETEEEIDYGWSEDETEDTPEHLRRKTVLFPSLKRVAGKDFFWSPFGNRLRVFGTIENVAVLGELEGYDNEIEAVEIPVVGEQGEIKTSRGIAKVEIESGKVDALLQAIKV